MDENDQLILASITCMLFEIFKVYWIREIKGKYAKGTEDDQAIHDSLTNLMKFARDFEIIPDTLTAKQSFLIWYTLTQSHEDLPADGIYETNSQIDLPFDKGIYWKLSQFSVYIYKAAIVSYEEKMMDKEENSTKKLLYFLRRLERSNGFMQIQKKTNRPMNSETTLLPNQEVLQEIFGQSSIDSDLTLLPTFLENERAVSAILSENLSDREKSTILRERMRGDQDAKKRLSINDDTEAYLEKMIDDLKRVFEIYCSIGEPMNTEKLKSAKAIKLIKDCKLLKSKRYLEISDEQIRKYKRVTTLSTIQVDLVFANLTANPNVSVYDSKDDNLSQMSQSRIGGVSMMRSMQGRSMFEKSSMSKHMFSTSMAESSRQDGGASNSKGKMDFEHFLKFLEGISSKVFPAIPVSEGFRYLIADFILPLLSNKKLAESRCVQNNQILDLVTKLEAEDMVEFLTCLHSSILKFFQRYSDARMMMSFESYLKFCSDFCIFPDLINKPMLYRIFHTLSHINEMQFPDSSQHQSMMGGSSMMGEGFKDYLDEHLFVESLALCALQIEGYPEELSEVEKCIRFVEKMVNSEKDRTPSVNDIEKISNMLNKKEIIIPFREQYDWYFEERYAQAAMAEGTKQSRMSFSDVFDQPSILGDVDDFDGEEP